MTDSGTGLIGKPLPRVEDLRLLTGHGRFSDDVDRPGQTYAVMVRAPHANARIDEIDLVNGRLELSGLAGDVAADLVNGDVIAEGLSGDVEIETVNGDVEMQMSQVDANRSIRIDSVNGSIELVPPVDAGADVEASTVHGRISNDFGIEVKRGRYVGRSMRGEIGGGGARVELENVNGAIRLRSP